jgi:BA14K-like protein
MRLLIATIATLALLASPASACFKKRAHIASPAPHAMRFGDHHDGGGHGGGGDHDRGGGRGGNVFVNNGGGGFGGFLGGGGFNIGNIGSSVVGGVISGGITNWLFPPQPQVVVVRPQPVVVVQPQQQAFAPWTPAWYDMCAGKFRSFDAKTGYYQGFDGVPHFCS